MVCLYDKKVIRQALKTEFGFDDPSILDRIDRCLSMCPATDAIPVIFIREYGKKHDVVCETNLHCMINSYNEEVDPYDRIPKFLDF